MKTRSLACAGTSRSALILICVAIAMFTVQISTALGQEAQNIAVVIKVVGSVVAQRADGSPWKAATRGLVLSSGDKLRTEQRGEVAVLFVDDKSLLKISEETEITFNATRDGRTVSKRVWMSAGSLWARVTKAEEPHFQVETPTSVASVKGSEFYSLENRESGNTLHALTGAYRYSNKFGGIDIGGGMTGKSDGQSPPTSRATRGGEVPTFGGGVDGFGNSGGTQGVGDDGAAPGDLRAEANSTSSITVSWGDVFMDETGFEIERQLGDAWLPLAEVGVNVSSFDDEGLETATEYCYRVRGIAAATSSDWSKIGCVSTLAIGDPSLLTATAAVLGEIGLAWVDNSNSEEAYEIHRSVDGGSMLPLETLDPDAESFVDTEIEGFTEYCYRVRAILPDGPSQMSNTACSIPLDDGVIDMNERVIRVEMIDEDGNIRILVIEIVPPE